MGNWVLFDNLRLCTFRTFQECEILPKHSLWQFIKKSALHICRIHSHSETIFLTLNFLLGLSSILNFGRKSNVNSPFFPDHPKSRVTIAFMIQPEESSSFKAKTS